MGGGGEGVTAREEAVFGEDGDGVEHEDECLWCNVSWGTVRRRGLRVG